MRKQVKEYRRKAYDAAIRAGLDRDYESMEKVFSAMIRRTKRVHEL